VIPPAFDYVRPADLDEALRILSERQGSAKLLAGGFSLLPLLKLRLAEPALLIDLRDVPDLDQITRDGDIIRIGARVTHRQIQANAELALLAPILREAAAGIADPQIRNWGTIGGSCAHADPAADWPAVLIALRGGFVCESVAGSRLIPAREFFVDTFTTEIRPDEVLTEVRVPVPPRRSGSAYAKLERRSGDFSTVGVGAQVRLGPDGRIEEVGLGLTAVADAPFAAVRAEAVLSGSQPSEEMYREAGIAAAAQSRPAADSHGPVDYKLAMVREMTVRALRSAVARANAAKEV
jgi:carbon-monoxide dehydrogenase medium subunit